MDRRLVLWMGVAALVLVLFAPWVWGQEPVVRALFFYSRDCPHCLAIQEEVIPALQERFGDRLDLHQLEISDPAVYRLLLEMEEAYHVPPEKATVPELFVGRDVLLGEASIRQEAEALVERYLEAGGTEWPPLYVAYLEAAPAPPVTATPEPLPTRHLCPTCAEEPPVRADVPVVHLYYFGDRRCEPCLALERDFLRPLQEAYGERLQVDRRDLEGSAQDYALLQALEAAYGVTESRLPQVYIGKYALVGEQEVRERLREHIDMYLALGGVGLPTVPTVTFPATLPAPTPTPEPAAASAWRPSGLLLAATGVGLAVLLGLVLVLRRGRTKAT
ncbi:MAG: hypothetical protein ACP5UM_12295 [Anaerolineae bacterium]